MLPVEPHLKNLVLNIVQKNKRWETNTRNQEIKKLIITFKVESTRIRCFKGYHPTVFTSV